MRTGSVCVRESQLIMCSWKWGTKKKKLARIKEKEVQHTRQHKKSKQKQQKRRHEQVKQRVESTHRGFSRR